MKRTIPFVVSCLSLFVWGFLLLPLNLQAAVVDHIPSTFAPGDTLIFSIEDCDDEVSICLDSLPLSESANLEITVNGEPYANILAGCNFDTTSAYTYSTLFGQGTLGPYELTNWTVRGTVFTGIFNNIPDLVDSMNLWDPMGNWQLDTTAQLIAGGDGSANYSNMTVNVAATSTPSAIGYNFGMAANGTALLFGKGVHRVSIFDTLNNTVRNAIIAVACAGSTNLDRRVRPDETGTFCLDFSRLSSEVEVIGFCSQLSQENVDFQFVNNDSCIDFTGVKIGFDTACIVVCDAFAICDTTRLIVETYDVPHYREATINLEEGTTQSYCLDTTVLFGGITQLLDYCPSKNGLEAMVDLDQTAFCATVSGLTAGVDTACLVLCNELGKCDTTILYINVHPTPTVETINLELTLGDTLTVCPQTTELAGLVTGIDNFCENNPSETIIFTINNVDLCFKITAENVGVDSICAVICDNFLICDTTYYVVTVVSPSNSPSLTATPDADTTSINSPIAVNILGNDNIPDGVIAEMGLISIDGVPVNGTFSLGVDGILNYNPNLDFCEGTDQVLYRICNLTGCDTANVSIYVECTTPPTGMKIYNGFSPNGDGYNDFFKIDGISQFPNNQLTVFNRWGVKVFQMKGYKSAWDGTWNKKDLPSGTYFYLLDDGEGKKYSGYLHLQR